MNELTFVFTEARLRDLLPPAKGKRARYYDSAQTGLSLRVTSAGTKTFNLFKKVNSRLVDLTLGGWPAITVAGARLLVQAKVQQLAAGVDLQASKRAIRKETTLAELFNEYLELYAKPRKKSAKEDEGLWHRYFQVLQARRLSAITPSDVQSWHDRIGKLNGHVAANRAHSLVRKMFNFAKARGLGIPNPAIGVLRFRERSRERFMSAEELRHFLAALSAETDIQSKEFFLVALLTGARRANVLAMRWSEIDMANGVWRIAGETSKSGDDLVVVLAPQVVALLAIRKQSTTGPWVFPGSGKTGHFMEPKKAFRRITKRAELSRLLLLIATAKGGGPADLDALLLQAQNDIDQLTIQSIRRSVKLPKGSDPAEVITERYREQARALGIDVDGTDMADLRIHDLRRTLGSWQAANGASLSIIGRSLGHKQIQTTAIYARLSLDPVRTSVGSAVDSILLSAGRPLIISKEPDEHPPSLP